MIRRTRTALFTAGLVLATIYLCAAFRPTTVPAARAQSGTQAEPDRSSAPTASGMSGAVQEAVVSSFPQPLFADPVVALLPSPKYAFDRTLYLLTAGQVFRSTDGGENWSVLGIGVQSAAGDQEPITRFVHGSVVDAGNNQHLLLLLTSDGQFMTLEPGLADWQPHEQRFDPDAVMRGDFSLEHALRIMHSGAHIRKDADGETVARTHDGTSMYESRVVRVEHLTGQYPQRTLVTTATYPVQPFGNPCQPCPMTVHAAQFVQNPYGWHVAVDPGGFDLVVQTSDQAPYGEMLSLGSGLYALRFEDTWRADGNSRTVATILAPVDGRYAAVFQAIVRENNRSAMDCTSNAAACFEYEAELSLGDEGIAGFRDIYYTVTGTRTDNGTVVPYNEDNVYSFDGRQYTLSETTAPTGELIVDIEYRDDFYLEAFGYSRGAPNIAHYVLVVPAAEAHLFDSVPVFTSIQMPATADGPIRLVQDRQEYAWVLDYLHIATQGKFVGRFPAGDYLVKAAFLAAPVSKEQLGLGEDVILWPGVTGGGASTREYIETTVNTGQTTAVDVVLTDANGWACPWLYVHDGESYVRVTEVLRNLEGADARRSEETHLGPTPVVGGAVRLQLVEEKPEISYVDQLTVMINGVRVQPQGDLTDRLLSVDGKMLTLREGETTELVFPVPPRFEQAKSVDVTIVAEGYYVRARN